MDQLRVCVLTRLACDLTYINILCCLQGFLGGAGDALINQAKEALKQKAAEFIQDAIQDTFIQKHVDTKRILPSIQNLNVVSGSFYFECYTRVYVVIEK